MSETTPPPNAGAPKTISGEIALPKLAVSLTMPEEPARPAADKPPRVRTQHTVSINGAPLSYTATAGTLTLRDDDGKEKASFFHVAYVKDGVDHPAQRPVMFAFNGGPGSSSVWLHLGAWGPRRVTLGPEGEQLPPPPQLRDNEYSLLDQTDLVFIDPVGTGYSKPAAGVEPKEFHGVEEDLASVGRFIATWLTEHQRWLSPKYLGGESYGTTRAAGLANLLFDTYGITLNGIILVSVVLNMQTIRFALGNDLPHLLYLPSFAATAWFHGQLAPELQARPLADLVAEVREFAASEYNVALMRGADLPPTERQRVVRKLARYTGLDRDYLTANDLRIWMGRFNKELLRRQGRTVGRFDSRCLGSDRDAVGEYPEYDASFTEILGAFTGALNAYLRGELQHEAEVRYKISGWDSIKWNYGDYQNQYLDVADRLRQALHKNPHLRVFVCNGYYDLATPFYATEYTFSHLDLRPDLRANIAMGYYEAGHMMYTKETELAKMAADLRGFLAGQ
ncbi:MAG: hypothetical protein IT204_13460 [Fimbriimonadaceae bacterium]|nr:hypothetical protein [Fimbriimonadaceae bacterium]